ncbi:hypothetical protein Hanom_Chr03g00236361 [Helianthus anomalus]
MGDLLFSKSTLGKATQSIQPSSSLKFSNVNKHFSRKRDTGEVVRERLGVHCDPGSTPTLPIIFYGIQVKGEYGWHRFVLYGR